MFRQLGMTRAVVGEKGFDGRALSDIGALFAAADDLFESAEEEDLYANGLGGWRHMWIVTRVRAGLVTVLSFPLFANVLPPWRWRM